MSDDFVGTLLVVLVVCIIVFLVLREFFCWYWKQNEIVYQLESISLELKKLNSKLEVAENDEGNDSDS